MDFELTDEQRMIKKTASEIAEEYGPEYWREKEEEGKFGEEFWEALRSAGFHGIPLPEEYGGAGMGMLDMLIAMEELCADGCGMGGAWYLILTTIFGGISVMKHGSNGQKEKYLPGIASGEIEFCMGLTEPDAGSNALNTQTTAERDDDGWVINGNKQFVSGADRADAILIVTRTTPLEGTEKRTEGISLFLADLPDESVEVNPIPKHGINYSKSCELAMDDLRLPVDSLLGEEGNGWYQILDVLNTERMSFSAAAVGIGRLASKLAVEYSKERKVFGNVPIGSYQGLQFPLAEALSELESASLHAKKAAWLWDRGSSSREVGAVANMAKVSAVEAATKTVYHSMQVFGGYGYAREYDIERLWREVNLIRLAPVTQQMGLNFVGQNVLGMPRSY